MCATLMERFDIRLRIPLAASSFFLLIQGTLRPDENTFTNLPRQDSMGECHNQLSTQLDVLFIFLELGPPQINPCLPPADAAQVSSTFSTTTRPAATRSSEPSFPHPSHHRIIPSSTFSDPT